MTDRTCRTALVCVSVCCLVLASPAGACDVPVFRYALERWEPGLFGVLIFHREALAGEQKAAADWLKERCADRQRPCNMDVLAVNVDGEMSKFIAAVWKTQKDVALPWTVVCYPERDPADGVAWAGPLTPANARAIVDSPARQEVAKRILAGDSAVWVLIDSGDAGKDDAAAKTLQAQLKEMEKVLELPQPAPADWGPPETEGDAAPPRPKLRLAFSVLRLDKTAPTEAAFASMLMRTEPDLIEKYSSEPMAFAFFGRGRAFPALVGKGINRDMIGDVCAFLTGRCSCEIKSMNPGTDIVFLADWQAIFDEDPQTAPELPAAIAQPAAATSPPAALTVAITAPPVAARQDAGSGSAPLLRNVLIAMVLAGIAAAALALWLTRRTARS